MLQILNKQIHTFQIGICLDFRQKHQKNFFRISSTIAVSDRPCTWIIGIGKLRMHIVDTITYKSHVNNLETLIPDPYTGNRNTSHTQF